MYSFLLSDLVKTTIFLPFEARKQRIQLYHSLSEIKLSTVANFMVRAYFPMILRDSIFRVITLGTFLNSLNVEHKPTLKYNLGEIRDFIKLKSEQGEKISFHYFIDYSKFNIRNPPNIILIKMLFCTLIATVITHPLDVITTKMLTQTRLKYKGLFQSYNLILKEEGSKKLFMSGLSLRCSFNMISAMVVLVMYEGLCNHLNKYYEGE